VDVDTMNNLLAFGGAGLAVVSALKDPTPQNIVRSSQQTVTALNLIAKDPRLAQLSGALGAIGVGLNVLDFASNPNPQTALSAMLSIGSVVAPEITVPLAAVLTVAQAVLPSPVTNVINTVYKIGSSAVHVAGEVIGGVVNTAVKTVTSVVKSTLFPLLICPTQPRWLHHRCFSSFRSLVN
jgi:hypothetical protein